MIRALYSYPQKLGAGRVCYTAWNQVNSLASAGALVTVFPGVLHRALPSSVTVRPTLSRGRYRIPYKALGRFRALALHDWIVARRLGQLKEHVDVVHAWPMAAFHTLKAAARLGIPTVLERPNAHTRFAYQTVQEECARIGVALPADHEHTFNAQVLKREEAEYALADYLLCPSDFVAYTFTQQGFPEHKLKRHQYGFDQERFYPLTQTREGTGLRILFVGGCAPRKGVHYALEAWLKSPAHRTGKFQIAGDFVPGYAEKLGAMLSHPSVQVLGHRTDVAELMRQNDILILPSIEEGSALVTSEARGSGCVLLVSDASGAICQHMENALVHHARDVEALTQHITMLDDDRGLLERLRTNSLRTVNEITWTAAGVRLLEVYREVLRAKDTSTTAPSPSYAGV